MRRVSATFGALLLAVIASNNAYACANHGAESTSEKLAFNECFGKRLAADDRNDKQSTAKIAIQQKWCDTELHHWFDALSKESNEPMKTKSEKQHAYSAFRAKTIKAHFDVIRDTGHNPFFDNAGAEDLK